MNPFVLFLLSLALGYYLSLLVSHPKKKKHLLPIVRYKNVDIMPNFRTHYKNRTYWLHHWMYCMIVACALFVAVDSFSQLLLLKGAAIGGVFQGLRYPDRFKFRHPRMRVK